MYPNLAIHHAAMDLLSARCKLDTIRARLDRLEAAPPIPTAQQRQQEEQQKKVNLFWSLADEKLSANLTMKPAEACQQVLYEHPEFKAVYPRTQD